MTVLTEKKTQEVVRLLAEIDREVRGRSRPLRIINLTRRVRLIIYKSGRYDNRAGYSVPGRDGCPV